LREIGYDAFDDWFAAGPEADDFWQKYEQARGRTYAEALKGLAVNNVVNFDRTHLDRCDIGTLVLPAGKSGHLELGRCIGQGKQTYIVFPEGIVGKLPESWLWLTALFEGEGSLTRNGK